MPNRKLSHILAAIIVGLCVSLFPQKTYAHQAALITFEPQQMQLSVGEQKSFIINLVPHHEENGISGFDICLSYDPSSLTIAEIYTPIDVTTGNSSKFQELRKQIDNTKGRTCFVYVSILPDEELSRGINVSAIASAQGNGEGVITVDNSQIVGNIAGDEYEVKSSPLNYTISGQSVAAQSATATPLQQPGIISRLIAFIKQLFPFLQ